MIIFYELAQHGMSHAQFARVFVQTAASACPDEQLRMYAQPSHLACVFDGGDPQLDGRVEKLPFTSRHAGFWKRALTALRFLHQTYGPLQAERPQVIFLTGEPCHIWAARLYRMVTPGFRCHLVLHGDINDMRGPRSRNPLRRLQDYVCSIGRARHADVRMLTLENHIRTNIDAILPGTAPYIDVFRHPCLPVSIDWAAANPAERELRFGLLGIAGRSKGLDVFARLALRARRDLGRQPSFRLIGKLQSGTEHLDLGGISGPLPFSKEWLPRAQFDDELTRLHYVILPYNMDYYGLSASGVLLDVLRWRKPMIAFDTPVVRELVAQFGDIGYICQSEDEMAQVIDSLIDGFDSARYALQQRNLDAAYRARLPEKMAAEFLALRGAPLPAPALKAA